MGARVQIPSPASQSKNMKTGPTNMHMQALIADLKKEGHSQKAPIWTRVARELSRSTRQRRIVNLSRLNRHTKKDETVVVPGKVLGSGALAHSLTVAAFSFSTSAKQAIEQANGKTLTIAELMKQKPKRIRIIG